MNLYTLYTNASNLTYAVHGELAKTAVGLVAHDFCFCYRNENEKVILMSNVLTNCSIRFVTGGAFPLYST